MIGKKVDAILQELGYVDKWIAEGVVEGKARGKAEFGRNAVLDVLRTRFKRVPKRIETAIQQMNDPVKKIQTAQ